MREVGRIQQGFFPTPDRVVEMIAKMITPEVKEHNLLTVVDAGCGEGRAIHDLRRHWLDKYPGLNCKLLGVESEKLRAQKAHELFHAGPGTGECIWAAIEDCRMDNPESGFSNDIEASMLWFNPPYDRIRGAGRMELALYEDVIDWTARNFGLLVFIVPDYVLTNEDTGMAVAIEREFQILRRMRFPEPEYQDFKQAVVIARRRPRAMRASIVGHPSWAMNSDTWPVMDDKGSPKEIKVYTQRGTRTIARSKIGVDVIQDFVNNSPLRGQLLMDALAEPPPIGRPPLPLSSGHLALALAGGLCDGVVPNGDDRFMVKGSLKSCVRKVARKEKRNKDDEVIADIDVYRTRYEMVVRCLRNDGSIEEFTSADPGEELAAALEGDGEEDGEKAGAE